MDKGSDVLLFFLLFQWGIQQLHLPGGLEMAGKKNSRTTVACSILVDGVSSRKKKLAHGTFSEMTGKKTCVVALFTPAVVASTLARRDWFIGNSRRCSITERKVSPYSSSPTVIQPSAGSSNLPSCLYCSFSSSGCRPSLAHLHYLALH
jgi:hypothetical protein